MIIHDFSRTVYPLHQVTLFARDPSAEMLTSDTGWRRVIPCLKLQVISRKRSTNYGALLRKMTCNLRHPMTLRHPVAGSSGTAPTTRSTLHWVLCTTVTGFVRLCHLTELTRLVWGRSKCPPRCIQKYRSLLQNIVSFTGLFCKRVL